MSYEMVTVNANITVAVRLTESGKSVVHKHFAKINETSPYDHQPKIVDNMYHFLLWEMMAIFGDYMYNGASLFVDNNITLMKPI